MNPRLSRRSFLKSGAGLACAAPMLAALISPARATRGVRKMKLCLSPGAIGVRAGPREVIALAHRYRFDAVEPNEHFLAGLGESRMTELLAELKQDKLSFGAAGLPVDFRGDETKFRADLAGLPAEAAVLQRAGVDRISTWVSPSHRSLSYTENLHRHATRLREVAAVLEAHGQHLGLEYVGTPSLRQGRSHPFIHSMRGMKELIRRISANNVGFVLDSWHWWTAGETADDILSLTAEEVVSVDLNDAPANIPLDQQQDGRRELPCATGVIPISDFLNALHRIGYDGPARAEPFNRALNALPDDQACADVIKALRKAMALVKI